MKTMFKTLAAMQSIAIIAIAAIIGFTMIACGNDTTTEAGHTHTWGSYVQTTPPTCTTAGIKTRACTIDSSHIDTVTEAGDPALGHDWDYADGATPPDCETGGHGSRECRRAGCSEVEHDVDFPKLGHNYLEWTAPTCETAGNSTRTCTRDDCDHEDTRLTGYAALGHNYPEWTAPTCETAGNSKRTCTRNDCDHEDTRLTGYAALGHDFNWAAHTSGIRECQRNDCSHTAGIGNTGPGGGKIFYVAPAGFTMTDDSTTAYYLEAALADMSELIRWSTAAGTPYIDVTGTETAIGTGRKNTALIIAADPYVDYDHAALSCDKYSNNGKTDWFLPSKDELNELYTNKNIVGSLGTDYYWSSSQYNNNFAWFQGFSYDNQNSLNKDSTLSVRAVRAF